MSELTFATYMIYMNNRSIFTCINNCVRMLGKMLKWKYDLSKILKFGPSMRYIQRNFFPDPMRASNV